MASFRKSAKTCLELDICDEKIIGVIGGKREDVNARASKRTSDRFQDACLAKRYRPENAQAPERTLCPYVLRDRRLGAYDGQLLRRARYRDERPIQAPCRDAGKRFEPCDRKPVRE
jgi:hypothetical protein